MNRSKICVPSTLFTMAAVSVSLPNLAFAGDDPDNPAVAVVAELGPLGQCYGSPFHRHEKALPLFKKQPLKAGDEVSCPPPGEVDIAWLRSDTVLIYKAAEWYTIGAVLPKDAAPKSSPARRSSIDYEIYNVALMRAQAVADVAVPQGASSATTSKYAGWKDSGDSYNAISSATTPTYSFAKLDGNDERTRPANAEELWRQLTGGHKKATEKSNKVVALDPRFQETLRAWAVIGASAPITSADAPASEPMGIKYATTDWKSLSGEVGTPVWTQTPEDIIVLEKPSAQTSTPEFSAHYGNQWTFVDPALWQAAITGEHSSPRKPTPADRALEKRVLAALNAEGLAGADVTVKADAKSGTVALGGIVTVPSWSARATYVTTQVKGVNAVQDDIFVDLVSPTLLPKQ